MGCLYRRGAIWWVKYHRNGRAFYETSGSRKETDAKRLLQLREGDVARGVPITPRVGRVRFEEAAEDVVNDYRVNGKRSLAEVQGRLKKHLTPYFGGRRLAAITTADVRAFIAKRQADPILVRAGHRVRRSGRWIEVPEKSRPVSNAEINRELAILKRAFTLAIQAGKLLHRPHIPMLRENNVRTGFFEQEQFEALRGHLLAPLQAVVTFAYITGWRIDSEVLTLRWHQVDLKAGTVTLDVGTTKNREGRIFPLTTDLRTLLEAQKMVTEAVSRRRGQIVPWVFHRDGKPIKDYRKAWDKARQRAGCPARIPHDFRRTAVRNLVRAGIPERVAMQMTGHKTRSVFERYNIVSEGDLTDAALRLDAFSADSGLAVIAHGGHARL